MLHFPVLLEESINFLVNDQDGNYIDCTFGRGGHSKEILNRISSNGYLTSFDKDPEASKFSKNFPQNNFKMFHDSFKNLDNYFKDNSIDGILYDLGVCSTHFDNPLRGFSFNQEGPIDMRFNNKNGQPLSEWLNKATIKEISEILYNFGDEKHGTLIAKAIVKKISENSLRNTKDLANTIEEVYPEKRNKTHPATKSFQAFRIFINDELEELQKSLRGASKIIKKGGIIVTIAFQSLEDTIIKNYFRPTIKKFPKDIPINNETKKSFECIAKKIKPSNEETKKNPRSRSAIMRVFKKL